jgi:hypothetical protein
VDRPSGLFTGAHFDADDHLEAIQFGRPDTTDDTVTCSTSPSTRNRKKTAEPRMINPQV